MSSQANYLDEVVAAENELRKQFRDTGKYFKRTASVSNIDDFPSDSAHLIGSRSKS